MNIVSFVILHYKDREITDSCVQSILQMDNQECIRIVIVDNDIQKGKHDRQTLKKYYERNSRISVLTIYENGGFSYANNMGYWYSREKLKASCIIVLNNDIQFAQRDFIKRLEESCLNHFCHIIGPDVICRNEKIHQNPMDLRTRTREEAEFTVRMNRLALKFYPFIYPVLFWKLKRGEKKKRQKVRGNAEFYQILQKDVVLFGACLIFTSNFVEKEDIAFTPETRFFYEEYILAYRCKKRGYHMIYDPSLKVYHENGAATKKTFGSEWKHYRFMLERTAEAGETYLKMLLEDDLCVTQKGQ